MAGFRRPVRFSLTPLFCDMSYPLAGPEQSQQTTTAGHIQGKPRKLRDKFKLIP